LKSNKTVHICGDFKLTVNKLSKLDRYPIPRIVDLFSKSAGGKLFSKLDLSQAYLQVCLEEEAKKFIVVNAHKGLYRYNQLPYGISSSPGIFQRTMESLLQGIPHVVVYLDDILVTGGTPKEHMCHLREVLLRLSTAGLRLQKNKCTFMVT
jgi:DNA-binding phage protein